MNISDKVVLITGGASGLGLATGRYLATRKGARIAVLDLDAEAGARAVADIGEARATFVRADVSSEEQVRDAVAAVVQRFGTVHVCINGAAVPNAFRVLDKAGQPAPLARFAQATAVNINGVFNVMAQCAAQMARNEPEGGEERGVVINVSSGAAYEGQVGQCAYAASKAALLGLNMPAARELGALGIRVNAIAPGLFLTPMVAGMPEAALRSLREQMQAPPRLGQLDEFAHCCAFVIENAYLNAHTIRLDGAARMRAR
jgi:NAD(P)-dependent dehydrogenase (short-subunit alcohol dehydrogenase family)